MSNLPTDLVLKQILGRVARRLSALGLTEHAVEQRAGATVGTLRNWRRGAMPRIDTLRIIAPALQTTPEWLSYGAGPETEDEAALMRPALPVPRVSWVSAGAFAISDAVMPSEDFGRHILVPDLTPGEWYAFDIPDGYDSMDRISPPGSVIIVNRRHKRLVNNACYIITDGEGGSTYKRYRQGPDRFEPVSTNPVHEPLFPDPGNMPGIFGRVHRSILDM